MKNILIVSAVSQELKAINEKIKELNISWFKISYFSTWIGNYNMILNLTRFLENIDFDFVINIWVCWYKAEYIESFQVSRVFNISNKKEIIIPYIIDFLELRSIATSENVIYDWEKIGVEDFVDMESYGFELVCDNFKIPRLLLKVPVDKIWIETKDFDFKKAKKSLKTNIDYNLLFEKIDEYLSKIEKEENLDIYFKNYNFTFSEKEIFKKYYYRYKSLVGNDFDKYFEENKLEVKKTFLNNLWLFLDNYLVR